MPILVLPFPAIDPVAISIGPLSVRWYALGFLAVADLCAAFSPLGLFFVRIGNFINEEQWGRPTDVPWAFVFPDVDSNPRHPSQLYEAGLEGLLLLIVLGIIVQRGGFKRPG